MTTLFFIHGTGGRNEAVAQTSSIIKDKLSHLGKSLTFAFSDWGATVGTRLHGNGASIPKYASTRSSQNNGSDEIVIWSFLIADPLIELRALASSTVDRVAMPGYVSPAKGVIEKLKSRAADSEFQALLRKAQLETYFSEAFQAVVNSEVCNVAIATPTERGKLENALARAVIACTLIQAEGDDDPGSDRCQLPSISDPALRDELIQRLGSDVATRDFGQTLLQGGLRLVSRVATPIVVRKRGALSDLVYPFPCDIISYQTKGEPFIQHLADEIDKLKPPVLVLAHSLGGIMAVDLLTQRDFSNKVAHLVTVGSQAPLLYELDSLRSLRYGSSLPQHFPDWTNIYDERDLLSYVGGELFPGRVSDVMVDNGQPFPRAHSGYFVNPHVWKILESKLP
jgi:pimeloyl-ACP methyl ester carboxylesterase